MAGAGAGSEEWTGSEEWIYVLSHQEEAVEDAEEEKESNAADETASAQPSELDNKAAPSSLSSESKGGGAAGAQSYSDDGHRREDVEEYPDWYTPEEVEVETAYDAYTAALDRASARALAPEVDDELEVEIGSAYEAYVAALDRRAAAKITTTTEPSKNPPNADDDKASAQPPESDAEYRHQQEKGYYTYTPEELEIVKAAQDYVAAYRRAAEMHDELEIQKVNRDLQFRAYITEDSYNPDESEIEVAFEAYMAEFRRAAEMADELEIQKGSRDRACRAYVAAQERASAAKVVVDGGCDRDYSAAAPARRGNGVTGNTYYDTYGEEPGPYAGGSADPASLGLGSGYDYGYYNRCFPGTATGSGYGYGYGSYDGYYYGEPYTYPYVPGYTTAAAAYQAPPRLSTNMLPCPLPTPVPYFYPAATPAPVSVRPPGSHTSYYTRDPSTQTVAPTTTTQQQEPPHCHYH